MFRYKPVALVEDVDDGPAKLDIQRAIRVACKELVTECSEPFDDLVKVGNLFSISSSEQDYEVHGHILKVAAHAVSRLQFCVFGVQS